MTSRPFGAGVIDEGQHRFGSAGKRLPVIEVGDVGGPLAAPADLDRLAERIEVTVAERVAHVGVVEAPVGRRLARQLRQLIGAGIGAGRIVQP